MPQTDTSVTLVWRASNTLVLAPGAFGTLTRAVSESNLYARIGLTHLRADRSALLFCDSARHSCCNLGRRRNQVLLLLLFKAASMWTFRSQHVGGYLTEPEHGLLTNFRNSKLRAMKSDAKLRSGPDSHYASSRVGSIDAARGAAMLFVCLAHFSGAYFFDAGAGDTGEYLILIGMLASPTFVTVSGLVAGFLAVTRSGSFVQLRQKLIDRGLFLLVVGHVVLALTGAFAGRGFVHAYKVGYITDVVGFAVILGPWLVSVLKARLRIILAAGVFVSSWIAVFFWEPSGGIAAAAKHHLIGFPDLANSTSGDFPIFPWFAVYLAGTVIGERLGEYYRSKRQHVGHMMLARLGAIALTLGVAAKVALHVIRAGSPALERVHPVLMFSVSSYQKFPPGPVYLVLFGGAGMLLVAAILEAGRRGMQPFFLNQLRQIGLASLFIYIVQFYVYVVVLRSLRLPYTPFWPLLFLFSIVFLAKAAAVWNAREGNRFLTVGVAALLRVVERRKQSALTKQIGLDVSVS